MLVHYVGYSNIWRRVEGLWVTSLHFPLRYEACLVSSRLSATETRELSIVLFPCLSLRRIYLTSLAITIPAMALNLLKDGDGTERRKERLRCVAPCVLRDHGPRKRNLSLSQNLKNPLTPLSRGVGNRGISHLALGSRNKFEGICRIIHVKFCFSHDFEQSRLDCLPNNKDIFDILSFCDIFSGEKTRLLVTQLRIPLSFSH